MKKRVTVFAAIAVLLLTGWSPSLFASTIVAEFNWDGKHHQISLADLEAAIAELVIFRQENYKTRAGKAEYLNELIDKKLKHLAALEKGFDKDETLLGKAERVKHQLMIKRIAAIEVDEKISYTEEDLQQYYEARKDKYVKDEQCRATCLTLTDKNRAQEVLALIKGGEDILDVAQELTKTEELVGPGSRGAGNTGFFFRHDAPNWREFINAVFEQEVGEMTDEVVELETGNRNYYLIFRKEEYRPLYQRTLDEVRSSIEKAVEHEKKLQRLAEWVASLKQAGQLKIYSDRLPESLPEEQDVPMRAEGMVIAEFEWDGKHQITLEEMLGEIREFPEYKQKRYKNKEALEEHINLMAEGSLVFCLAKDRKLDEDPEVLEDVQDYLQKWMVNKITELEVDEKLVLTEEDYRRYYEAHKSDYIEPDQVRLTCITLADEERAKQVLQRLNGGEDIAEIANELAATGELRDPGDKGIPPGNTGFLSRRTVPELQRLIDVAFAMEIGQVTEDIVLIEFQGQRYYALFRKEEYREPRQRTLDDKHVRKNVENATEIATHNALMNNWIAQLRERAKVTIYINRIPDMPENSKSNPSSVGGSSAEETEAR